MINIDLKSIPTFLGWVATKIPNVYTLPTGNSFMYNPSTVGVSQVLDLLIAAGKSITITYGK